MSTKTTPQHRNTGNSNNIVNSPSPSRRTTPSTPPVRGPLLPSSETSFHKRLRTILLEHKKLRREWNELVLRGCLARSRAALELWTDIEIGIKFLEKSKGSLKEQKAGVKAGYLFQQSTRLSDQLGTIAAVVTSLTEVVASMKVLVDRVESLVIEAANTKSAAFAFREPLWVTWPLSRFSEGVQDLTSFYSPSLSLIQTLLSTLTTFPPLPSESEEEEKRPIGITNSRPSSEELQAAMSLLAVQPLIPGKGGEGGPEAWEEICTVEVGGWSDPR